MKEIFIEYNKIIWNIVSFKLEKNPFKIFSIIFDLIILVSIYFIIKIGSIDIEYSISIIKLIFIEYFVVFSIYCVIEYSEKSFFKETTNLCKHINSFFRDDFIKFNEYLYKNSINNFKKRVKIDKLPNKELMFVWKYRLKERKTTYVILLPFIATLALVNFEHITDILKFFGYQPAENIIKGLGEEFMIAIPLILDLLKYAIISIIYLDKILIISKSILKVDLLIELKK